MSRSTFTAGVDVGDRYSHLRLPDTETGEVVEESRVGTSPAAMERRFSACGPMRVAIEAGTHSPWLSRLLEGCGHEVLVANARKLKLICGEGKKNDRLDAENLPRNARSGSSRILNRSKGIPVGGQSVYRRPRAGETGMAHTSHSHRQCLGLGHLCGGHRLGKLSTHGCHTSGGKMRIQALTRLALEGPRPFARCVWQFVHI